MTMTSDHHLDIFIVEDPDSADKGLNGFSNFPGIAALADYPDAVVLGAHTLWYNQEMVDQSRIDITSPRHGTTMAHEIVNPTPLVTVSY
jgi:hypothetical protein